MRKYVDFLERNNLLIFYQGTRSEDLFSDQRTVLLTRLRTLSLR